MRKLASLLGKSDPVIVARYGEEYLVSNECLICAIPSSNLPTALAKRPELLATVLSGRAGAYRCRSGTVSEVDPQAVVRIFEEVRPRYQGWVTQVAALQRARTGLGLYQAVLRTDRKAVVWIDTEFLTAAGITAGGLVEMGGERDPIRVEHYVIAPACVDGAEAKAAAAGLMTAGHQLT